MIDIDALGVVKDVGSVKGGFFLAVDRGVSEAMAVAHVTEVSAQTLSDGSVNVWLYGGVKRQVLAGRFLRPMNAPDPVAFREACRDEVLARLP